MDRDTDDHPVIVSIAEHRAARGEVARPGVIVWLTDRTPDVDEAARAAAMRRHPARGTAARERPRDGSSPRHLRAVS